MSKINIYFKVIDGTTNPILKWISDIRSRNIQVWFDKNIIGDKALIAKIKTKSNIDFNQTDKSLRYFEWKIQKESHNIECINCGLMHLIARNDIDRTMFIVIDNTKYNHDQIVLFKDAIHEKELPDSFFKAPCFNTVDDVYNYCNEKGIFKFSLEDKKKFAYENGIGPIKEQGYIKNWPLVNTGIWICSIKAITKCLILQGKITLEKQILKKELLTLRRKTIIKKLSNNKKRGLI